jgi:hypothetical protein
VTCDVRNELNGRRLLTEKPVYSEQSNGNAGVPYMPRKFPKGVWRILAVLPKTDPYEAPEFISTDAWQEVDEWTIEDSHYGAKTGKKVKDYGYGLHFSTSPTTLGCGKIMRMSERDALSVVVKAALSGYVYLDVI